MLGAWEPPRGRSPACSPCPCWGLGWWRCLGPGVRSPSGWGRAASRPPAPFFLLCAQRALSQEGPGCLLSSVPSLLVPAVAVKAQGQPLTLEEFWGLPLVLGAAGLSPSWDVSVVTRRVRSDRVPSSSHCARPSDSAARFGLGWLTRPECFYWVSGHHAARRGTPADGQCHHKHRASAWELLGGSTEIAPSPRHIALEPGHGSSSFSVSPVAEGDGAGWLWV